MDQAVGRIRALLNRNLTVEDVLLYYRLYRFHQSLISKVLSRHRSLYPADQKITLEHVEIIMNRIMADEPTLKTDVVTLDQEVKAMTFVSTPKITPVATAPISNNANHGARTKAKSPYRQKGKGANNNYCVGCDSESHYTDDCSLYPSVTDKKSALKANGRCEDCRGIKIDNHYCRLHYLCRFCNDKHREQLCENREKNKQKKDR